MNNVCGTCKHYNEWENGYCDKINAVVEPEEYQCKEFENDTAYQDCLLDRSFDEQMRLVRRSELNEGR